MNEYIGYTNMTKFDVMKFTKTKQWKKEIPESQRASEAERLDKTSFKFCVLEILNSI